MRQLLRAEVDYDGSAIAKMGDDADQELLRVDKQPYDGLDGARRRFTAGGL